MGATAGKVALTSNNTQLNGPCPMSTAIVDLVGYGSAANCFEGAPAPGPSSNNQQAAQRRNNGCADDGENNFDFVVITPPVPRNSAAANNLVCTYAANETNAATELDFCNLQHPPATTAMTGTLTEFIYGRVFEVGVTESGGANPMVRAEIGYGPVTSNPQNQSGWTWAAAAFNVQTGNDDEYQYQILAPAPGTYRYASRFSLDGVFWTYCDLDGAGSNAGLSFHPGRLGTLTVTP
jgi:hypothetical protein